MLVLMLLSVLFLLKGAQGNLRHDAYVLYAAECRATLLTQHNQKTEPPDGSDYYVLGMPGQCTSSTYP